MHGVGFSSQGWRGVGRGVEYSRVQVPLARLLRCHEGTHFLWNMLKREMCHECKRKVLSMLSLRGSATLVDHVSLHPCIAAQVALLVEGRSEGLCSLAASLCSTLNALHQQSTPAAQQQQQQQDQHHQPMDIDAAVPAAGGEGSAGAVTVLMVRNLIQELAVRKSYGLKDGEVLGMH